MLQILRNRKRVHGNGYRLKHNIVCYLNEKIPINLISLDNDDPGRKRSESLKKVLNNSYEWPVPKKYGKDPGEAMPYMCIKSWVLKGLKLCKRS
ncbi:P4 alpha zinc-binding domain-containing protein [Candidatus Magnetomorum sp. HK-1]|nr:P4 alpha zinc-binding domain-containing protein [Candidatus Magnetomorum sp. HK-1]